MQALCKMKVTRLAAVLVVAILMVSMLMIPALAAEDASSNDLSGTGIAGEVTAIPAPTNGTGKTGDLENEWIHKWGLDKEENQVKIPTVTTDDVNGWVERKGNDVISIAQTTGRVLAVLGFFVSIIIIIIGALGNRRMMTGGFIGLAVSVLGYVALTYGKELMYLFSSWVMS